MGIWDLLFAPFAETEAVRNALIACLAVSLGSAPLGVFLVLRRMSLAGDVMTHTLLPGVAVAYLVIGASPAMMLVGGLASGVVAALLSVVAARTTLIREDAGLAAVYLIFLAVGVLILADQGEPEELLHVLFGNALEIDRATLIAIVGIVTVTVPVLALMFRPLVIESFDPAFLAAVGGGAVVHGVFMVLVMVNLVAGAAALGTLMTVGLMILPAIAARFWAASIGRIVATATVIALASSVIGLLLAHHGQLPPGPAIVLIAGLIFVASMLTGPQGGLLHRLRALPHLEG